MRARFPFIIIIALLLLTASPLRAGIRQGGINARGIVQSAEISGIDDDEISQDIRDAIRKLVGQPFDQQAADELVKRLQAEKPEFTATTRLLPGDPSDRVKVTFLLEKHENELDDKSNVNTRYTVERVEIQGYDEARLSQSIRDEFKKLIGEKLDQEKANEILHQIEDELRPRHSVIRRVVKGSDRQHIVVVYEVRSVRWIPFVAQPQQHFVYHSKQNFSAAVGANLFHNNDNRLYVGLVNDQDQFLERAAGFNLTFETTRVGTERLGIALRYSRYHNRWQPATELADRNAIYRERNHFDPSITFAFDPRFRVTAGVSTSELQMQYPSIHTSHGNAATGALDFRNVWGKTETGSHAVQASYEVRAGNHTLDSDFIYTRHLVQGQYMFGRHRNRLLIRFSAGTISGNAPLFERFSLGDTTTLRGWNKFDVAPTGGNRMVHATVQYGIGGPRGLEWVFSVDNRGRQVSGSGFRFHVFYDTGAVGERGAPLQAHHSAGFGFGSTGSSGFFIELGFPIRSDRVQPIFMTGFRF